MSNISESCMNAWVKMINEDKFTYNPDYDQTDDQFIAQDDYERIAKDIDDYYKKSEETGNIEGNLNEAEDEEKDSNLSSDVSDKTEGDEKTEKTDEALTPKEILKKLKEKNEKLAAEQAAVAKKVKKVSILEMYDGYVACEVTFNNGETKKMEFEIDEDEIDDMFEKIGRIALEKKVECDKDDAAIAIIRKRIDPTDTLDWFYKPTNTNLDQWFLDQDMEDDYLETSDRHSESWAEQMGLFADENGDFGDDSSFNSWDDGSSDSYFRQY